MHVKSVIVGIIAVASCFQGQVIAADAPAAALGSEKNPVAVTRFPTEVKLDGDPAKWEKIPALPAPWARKSAGLVKLAWREEGLYGCVQTKDAKMAVDVFHPWTQDCLELWLESDCARKYDIGDHSCQIVFAPNPDAGPGRAISLCANGGIAREGVLAMWKPIVGGYFVEFFIPAKALKVELHAGVKMGMNYAVDEKGSPIEEFFFDKEMDSSYSSPCTWGVIELK